MSIWPANVPGLPAGVQIRRSDRRRRTVAAFRENGQTIVVVPARMSSTEAAKHATELHERLARKSKKTQPSDVELAARADKLGRRFVPEAPAPASIRWSSRQKTLWGSCSSADRSIRLSDRLQGMPSYVIDYIILHELCHLVFPNHGGDFKELIKRYPERTRAQAYLAGVEFAHGQFD